MQALMLHKNVGLVTAAIILITSCSNQNSRTLQGLKYDGIHTFKVGKHSITIETKSFSLTEGDNGPAKLIVSANGAVTPLNSQFNNDLFLDIRPAYVSWHDIDQDHSQDLVIWKPDWNTLFASEYISSKDGKLHKLIVPWQQPLPESTG